MTDTISRYQADRIHGGDESAFRDFFHAHYPEAVGFAAKQLRDLSTAEDIVQGVMVRLWERREDIDPSRSLRAYLFSLVRTSVVDYFRHEAVKRRHVEHAREDMQTQGQQTDPFLQQDIDKAVESLEDKQRTVFVLNRFGGLTYAEVADVLDVSVKTVEKHMTRALKALRTDLKDWLMVLLLAALVAIWAGPASGQSRFQLERRSVSVSLTDASLAEALTRVASQAGVGIVFDDALVAGHRVDVACSPCRLGDALDHLLAPFGLGFNVTPGPILAVVSDERFDLRGQVVDAETGQSLPMAQIQFRETGAVSNLDGEFSISSVRGGEGILIASYVGYARREERLDPSLRQDLGIIRLQPEAVDVGEVTILAEPLIPAGYGSGGARSTVSGILHRIPAAASGGTLSAMAILPGIDATEERAGDLFIRGSTPRSNLMTWDGIPVYRADHFFGMVSAFSPMAVERISLYDRGAPARYGGRIGPVVEVESPSALGSTAIMAHASLLDAGTGIRIPVGQRVGAWFSARRSSPVIEQQTGYSAYFDNVIGQEFEANRPGFSFREVSGRLDALIGKRQHLSVSTMLSDDGLSRSSEADYRQIQVVNVPGQVDNPGRGDDARDDNPTDRDDTNQGRNSGNSGNDAGSVPGDDNPNNPFVRQTTITEREQLNLDWGQKGAALNWTGSWRSGASTHAQLVVSSDENAYLRSLTESSPDSVLSSGLQVSDTRLTSRTFKVHHEASNTIGKMTFGLFVDRFSVRDELGRSSIATGAAMAPDSIVTASRTIPGAHVSQQMTLGPATMDAGLRLARGSDDRPMAVSPRLSIALPLAVDWEVHASWGQYHQYLLRSMSSEVLTADRDQWRLVGKDERPARSRQSSVGVSSGGARWSASLDAWHRLTKGVPVLPPVDGDQEADFFQEDLSRALGAEISGQIRRERWLGWISYTRSSVRSSIGGEISESWFDALHDRPHAIKAAVSADLSNWTFTLTGSWASGRPVGLLLSPTVFLSADGSGIRGSAASGLEGERLPDYARLDARIGWQGRLAGVPLELVANLINITDRDNVRYRRLFTEGDTVHFRDVPMLGFTPGIHLRMGLDR